MFVVFTHDMFSNFFQQLFPLVLSLVFLVFLFNLWLYVLGWRFCFFVLSSECMVLLRSGRTVCLAEDLQVR